MLIKPGLYSLFISGAYNNPKLYNKVFIPYLFLGSKTRVASLQSFLPRMLEFVFIRTFVAKICETKKRNDLRKK